MFKKRILPILILAAVLFMTVPVLALSPVYQNADTGFHAAIEDDARLLTDGQIAVIYETMIPATEYCNVALKTISENRSGSAKAYAEKYYYQNFGNETGFVFLIDMDTRELYLAVSDGEAHDAITDTRSENIMDNVYRKATKGDYYGCAKEVFSETLTLLHGERIAQPMRYICNALLALIIGLLVCFELANRKATPGAASDREILTAAAVAFTAGAAATELVDRKKKYSPINTGSSYHGGGSHGGGSHGGFHGGGSHGGGFHGGGGGHRF